MKKVAFFTYLFSFPFSLAFSQIMETTTYRNTTTIPYIELDPTLYDFGYPINSLSFGVPGFNPSSGTHGRYFKATYGHRYITSTAEKTDNHGGFDYWSFIKDGDSTFNSQNPAPIVSMCDGTINEILDSTDVYLNTTALGRSVQVTCNQKSQAVAHLGDSSININYRHLSALGGAKIAVDSLISRGDTLGYLGDTGFTNIAHLHVSAQMNYPGEGDSFVHTARLFNPAKYPQLLDTLSDVTIKLLHHWEGTGSALFRVIYPFNQTANRFEFINGGDTFVYDKEVAYDVGSETRDNHDCLDNFQIYSYQFNGRYTAKLRYEGDSTNVPIIPYTSVNMPAIYPASPQRDDSLATYGYTHIPITEESVSHVYDFMVHGFEPSANSDAFVVKISDVWGYTVEGTFPAILPIELLSFDAVIVENKYVKTTWTTSSEINNDYFTIEKSLNGTTWEVSDIIEGAGNSYENLNYSHIDKTPYLGVSYYRLKQTDFNGEYTYSEIKSVNLSYQTNTNELKIYPNPTTNQVTIAFNEQGALKVIELFNSSGIQLSTLQTNAREENVNLNHLPSGVYFLKIKTENSVELIKVIKK